MPIINLTFSVTDAQANLIDALRGKLPRDEFLRTALELGLCDFLDESVKASKDYIYQGMLTMTESYSKARMSRAVSEPKEDITKRQSQ